MQSQLGIQLLEVKGRKAYLTKAGETMLRRSRQLIQDVEQLESLADTLDQGWEPEITLAVEVLYNRDFLYQILNQFRPISRGSRIKIRDEVISGSAEAINNKTADIVISNIVPQGYMANSICQAEMIAVCGTNNPEINKDNMNLDELAHCLQIVIADTGVAKSKQGWLKAEQRWTVASFFEAVNILKTGSGFCWMPRHFAQSFIEEGSITEITIQDLTKRIIQLNLTIPDRDNIGPATIALEQLFYQFHQS